MKRITWKWLLPVGLLILALVCHFYDTHEYRAGVYRDHAVNNLYYYGQHYPALVQRLSRGINFPALVLDYPLKDELEALYERNSDYTLISITPRDVGFFVGIVLFWYWVGSKLDRIQGRGSRAIRSRKVRVLGLAFGLLFGIANGVYAAQMIATRWLPERRIGAFGIAWACALIAYFTWRFAQEFGADRPRSISTP